MRLEQFTFCHSEESIHSEGCWLMWDMLPCVPASLSGDGEKVLLVSLVGFLYSLSYCRLARVYFSC